jgi:hypothetical protein
MWQERKTNRVVPLPAATPAAAAAAAPSPSPSPPPPLPPPRGYNTGPAASAARPVTFADVRRTPMSREELLTLPRSNQLSLLLETNIIQRGIYQTKINRLNSIIGLNEISIAKKQLERENAKTKLKQQPKLWLKLMNRTQLTEIDKQNRDLQKWVELGPEIISLEKENEMLKEENERNISEITILDSQLAAIESEMLDAETENIVDQNSGALYEWNVFGQPLQEEISDAELAHQISLL